MTDVPKVALVHFGEVFKDAMSGLNTGDRFEKGCEQWIKRLHPTEPDGRRSKHAEDHS